MKKLPILLFLLLAWPAELAAKPRQMVHLSRCGGQELKADQVLVIDLSAKVQPEKELERVLEEHELVAIRERVISGHSSAERTFKKVAKEAGKERCDAVVILRRQGLSPADPPVPGRCPTAKMTVSVGTRAMPVEVIFAELKKATKP